MNHKDILFPYEKVRPIQDEMIACVKKAIEESKKILVHAPTGIGKTISVLGPALNEAIKKKKIVLMLTARHTQHTLAIQTLRDIKKKHKVNFNVVDIIGKKWMCGVDLIERLSSGEFSEFCKTKKEDNSCELYSNTYNKKEPSIRAKKFIREIEEGPILSSEELIKEAKKQNLCPYEIAMQLTKRARVIIADYFYLFNPEILKKFLTRTERELDELIVIVDEGHNLAGRVKDLLSVNLSTFILNRAILESKENENTWAISFLSDLKNLLNELSSNNKSEALIGKVEFIKAVVDLKAGTEYETFGEEQKDKINIIETYNSIKDELEDIGLRLLKDKPRSYTLLIAQFLNGWLGPDEGYTRILSTRIGRGGKIIKLSYRCLDPSLITKDIIQNVYSLVIMSGTLSPLQFYKDILGFDKDNEGFVYDSPFPNKNRLNLVIPKTTTKFSLRGEKQYQEIAKESANLANTIKGNVLIFFPSYSLRDAIYPFFKFFCEKKIIAEIPGMTKQNKIDMMDEFKESKDKGAVLLAITSGSFGEGIDLPGDLLHGVIVVGIPLNPPDLETKQLIDYYDKRFAKGWEYGYVLPAITKVLQNAGRCIRSETDKGVIAFLDLRYAWNNYFKCFPADWEVIITKDYLKKIKEFFEDI